MAASNLDADDPITADDAQRALRAAHALRIDVREVGGPAGGADLVGEALA